MRLVIGSANLWKPVSGGGLGEVERDKNNRWTDRRNHTHFTIDTSIDNTVVTIVLYHMFFYCIVLSPY